MLIEVCQSVVLTLQSSQLFGQSCTHVGRIQRKRVNRTGLHPGTCSDEYAGDRITSYREILYRTLRSKTIGDNLVVLRQQCHDT